MDEWEIDKPLGQCWGSGKKIECGEQNNGTPAFQNPNDLQKVKGIGPKTVENIREWLKFE